MYKVTVVTSGIHNAVELGSRYCLTKKAVEKLVQLFQDLECGIKVEKFIHITGSCWCWTKLYY